MAPDQYSALFDTGCGARAQSSAHGELQKAGGSRMRLDILWPVGAVYQALPLCNNALRVYTARNEHAGCQEARH